MIFYMRNVDSHVIYVERFLFTRVTCFVTVENIPGTEDMSAIFVESDSSGLMSSNPMSVNT